MDYQKSLRNLNKMINKRFDKKKISFVNGAKYFSSGVFQNYLEFIPAIKYIKYFSGTGRIDSWKSNEMSEENIENVTKSNSNFAPTFVDHYLLSDIDFNGHCLINNISITKKVINLYISYKLNPQLRNLNTKFTLGYCLFGTIKLTNNSYLDKYNYSGIWHRIRFSFRISIT